MSLHTEIDDLLKKLTEEQRNLFSVNIELWKKTVAFNGRSQSTDSFEVDSGELMSEWENLLDKIYNMEFE